jgi:hypothetical protein
MLTFLLFVVLVDKLLGFLIFFVTVSAQTRRCLRFTGEAKGS